MPRKPSTQPNDVELSILKVLWDRGPSTVREVHEALAASRDAGYTSTSKMMQVMCDKGLLERDEEAKPQVYRPAEPEAQTQKQILRHLVSNVFGGSMRKLVLRAVETGKIKQSERDEIAKLLEKLEGDES